MNEVTAAPKRRVYEVKNTDDDTSRLVRAETKSKAEKFVFQPYEFSLPDGNRVGELMQAGVVIEDAKEAAT